MTNAELTLGAVVSQRREDLGISQVDLAWLARVSRNTISNMEREQGSPASATVARVAYALAGNQYGFSAIASGPDPAGPGWSGLQGIGLSFEGLWLTDKEVASTALELILNLNAADSVINARKAADAWREVHEAKTQLFRGGHDFGLSEGQLASGMATLRQCLLPHLREDEKSQIIRYWFEDHGWSPEDDMQEPRDTSDVSFFGAGKRVDVSLKNSGTGKRADEPILEDIKRSVIQGMHQWEQEQTPSVADSIETVAKYLDEGKAELAAFRRLPIMVQRSLLMHEFGDYSFFRPTDLSGASHVLLTFTDQKDPGFDQKKALDAHMNALVALDIATRVIYKIDGHNPTFEEVFDTVRDSLDLHGRGVRDPSRPTPRTPGGSLMLGAYEDADPEASDGSTE